MMQQFYKSTSSPIGDLIIRTTDTGISGIWFVEHHKPQGEIGQEAVNHPLLLQAETQLEEYFTGKRKAFDLPLFQSGTEFQLLVWQGLTQINYGALKSYSDLAEQIGHPKAVRAVGMTNGKNPISIVVPCHRVVGKNGRLTGYAGGLERKQWLIQHEQAQVNFQLDKLSQ